LVSKKTSKKTYHHGDLRRALMDASIEIIGTTGVDSLNLREVAKVAGVSPGAPYHHFVDRQEIFTEIAKEGFDLLEANMLHGRDSGRKDSIAKLNAIGKAYVSFAVTHPGHFRTMFRVDTHNSEDPELTTSGNKAFEILSQAIAECQKSGQAPKGDPLPLVLHAWSAVHGLSGLLIDGGIKKIPLPQNKLIEMLTKQIGQMFEALALKNK